MVFSGRRISPIFHHRLHLSSTIQQTFLAYQKDNFTNNSTNQVDQFNMNYGSLDNEDVLDSFDFRSFLNEDDAQAAFTFDASLNFGNADGVEAGTGEI